MNPSEQYKSLIFPTWPNLGEKSAVCNNQPWDWDITAEEISRIRMMAKPRRKELMTQLETRWNIYSTCKGQNWFFPISNENPTGAVLALALDYDLPISHDHIVSACEERKKLGGYCPAYIETSLSGNARCVWTFERSILTPNKKFADEFIKQLVALIDGENFLPGLDRKSYDSAMRWTNGGYWTELDFVKPIPAEVLLGIAVKVSSALYSSKSDLPFDRLEQLLTERYPRFPMFNGGRLKMRANGLRFWEDGSDNPNAAYVIDKGFFCVTGSKPVITWEELIGKQLVDTMRASNCGEAAKDVFYDGKNYFVKSSRMGFVDLGRSDVMLHIASHGFSRTCKKDEVTSPAEQVLKYVQTHNRVDGAAPLLFRPEGVIEYQNRCVLNLNRSKPLSMADKKAVTFDDFPWLWGFFNCFFANSELRPLDHFLAWWRRFYEGGITLRPTNGQALFICGPAGCGKNLMAELIVPMSMGGSAPNPYRYLMGDTSFSDDIFSAPVLAINDEDAPPDGKRSVFEQKVKSMVANNEHAFHPKFMKQIRIEWDGRLIVTLNNGPKDVGILPQLNPNTEGKVSYFLAQSHDHPFHDKHKTREIVAAELPYFLRWLVDSYQPPKGILIPDRFGVRSYHDPFLVRINRQEQSSYNLLELLAAWMSGTSWNGGLPEWRGTPTDLLRVMTGDETLEQLLKNWDPNKLSKALGDLARSQTPGVSFDPDSKGRNYIVSKVKVQATVQGRSAQQVSQTTLPSMAEEDDQ